MKKPIKMDDLGVPLILKTAKKRSNYIYIQLAAIQWSPPSAQPVAASNRLENGSLSTVHCLNIPRCSMGLVYLPTFTIKKTTQR